jgi:hypothetical protein
MRISWRSISWLQNDDDDGVHLTLCETFCLIVMVITYPKKKK